MVVRGQFMRFAEPGMVVDVGTKDFAIVIAQHPDVDRMGLVYGIRNKTTFVDEQFAPTLLGAQYLLRESQKSLDAGLLGLEAEIAKQRAENPLLAMLRGDDEPDFGGGNGRTN